MAPRTRHDRTSKTSTAKARRPLSNRPIQSILKLADPADDLPEFRVENADIWSLDGSHMMNLLDSNLRGMFKVYGTLRLDKGQIGHYSKGARNGPYEFEAEITSYAIDAAPIAEVWVGTACGWLKIQPSAQYATIYTEMSASVSLMYECLDLEDSIREERRVLKVEDFLFEYAMMDGRGNMKEQLKAMFEINAISILSHMYPLPDMKKTKLFMWLKENFPESHAYVGEQSRALAARQKAIALGSTQHLREQSPVRRPTTKVIPAKQIFVSRPAPLPKPPPPPPISISSSSSNTTEPQPKMTPSSSAHPQGAINIGNPQSLPAPMSHMPGADGEPARLPPMQVILDLINVQDPRTSKITTASLQNAIYQDWSLWWPPVAKGLVRLYSSAVLQQLPEAWNGTNLQKSLKDTMKEFCSSARREKEIASAMSRPQRPPRSRGSMSIAQIHAVTDNEWLAEAAEYRIIVHRKSKTKPVLKQDADTIDSPVARSPLPEAVSNISNNSTEVAKEFQTKADARAAHEAWIESITSRSRTPSPDRQSYEYKKAVVAMSQRITPRPKPTLPHRNAPHPTVGKLAIQTPRGQKGLPHTMEARLSGKMTKLKPKTTVNKRPADSSEARDSKRPRMSNSPSDNELESPTPHHREISPSTTSTTSHSENDDEGDGEQEAIKPRQLNMTRGPNGTMRCLGPQCHFMENLPETKDGRDRMLAHFGDHEREDPLLILAKREATLNGRTVNFLMEKLLEKEKADEEAKNDAAGWMREGANGETKKESVFGVDFDSFGKPIPKPIVRRHF